MHLPVFNRFSTRLALFFSATVILSISFTTLLTTYSFHRHQTAELRETLEGEARLIASDIDPDLFGRASSPGAYALVEKFHQASGMRITLIRSDGKVVAESDLPVERWSSIENHKDRPEVREALDEKSGHAIRHSETLGKDLLYVAVPARDNSRPLSDRPVIGVIRLAMPLVQVQARLALVSKELALIAGLMIVLSLVVALLLSHSISGPILYISETVDRLAGGDYSVRVRAFRAADHNQLANALNHLAENIQRVIQDLAHETTQLSTILSNMAEAVAAVDAQGHVIAINPALSDVFQINERDSLGRPFIEAVRNNQIHDLLKAVLADGRQRTGELHTYSPSEHVFEAHAVPLIQEGQPRGALLVLHDITRLRHLEQIRREFVANVSHELRTPLASIRGFAETLRLGAVDDKENRMEFLRAIENHTDQMTQLVDELLDLAAIESGQRKVVKKPTSLKKLVEDVLKGLSSFALKHQVTLGLDSWDDIPEVTCDPIQIKQVLGNLIENAVKFNTPKGTVNVSARREGPSVRITVKDTGAGIPASDLSRVFERFFRVDKARSRALGGTGLGLSIVKHIVEAHGGTVSVESVEGRGSAFHFSLPL